MNNPILRKVIIDQITDKPNPVIQWFDNTWDTLISISTDVYHNDYHIDRILNPKFNYPDPNKF